MQHANRTPAPQLVQPNYDRTELHNREAAVWTPIMIALITGFLTASFVTMIFWLLGASIMTNAKTFGFTFITTSLAAWLALVLHWKGLTTLEYWLGDLNNDQHLGPPPKVEYTINTFSQAGTMTGQHKYLFTAKPEQIDIFCNKTRRMGFPISRRPWVDSGIFTDQGWRTFYGELTAQKLVVMIKGANALSDPEGVQWADGVISEGDSSYNPSLDAFDAKKPTPSETQDGSTGK